MPVIVRAVRLHAGDAGPVANELTRAGRSTGRRPGGPSTTTARATGSSRTKTPLRRSSVYAACTTARPSVRCVPSVMPFSLPLPTSPSSSLSITTGDLPQRLGVVRHLGALRQRQRNDAVHRGRRRAHVAGYARDRGRAPPSAVPCLTRRVCGRGVARRQAASTVAPRRRRTSTPRARCGRFSSA